MPGRTRLPDRASLHLQAVAVDEEPLRRGAEVIERRPREPEARERCRLGPVGRGERELTDDATLVGDERDELAHAVRVDAEDEEETTPERLGELDLPERRIARDPPATPDAVRPDEGRADLVPGPEDEDV